MPIRAFNDEQIARLVAEHIAVPVASLEHVFGPGTKAAVRGYPHPVHGALSQLLHY
jgi:hypothetical protein